MTATALVRQTEICTEIRVEGAAHLSEDEQTFLQDGLRAEFERNGVQFVFGRSSARLGRYELICGENALGRLATYLSEHAARCAVRGGVCVALVTQCGALRTPHLCAIETYGVSIPDQDAETMHTPMPSALLLRQISQDAECSTSFLPPPPPVSSTTSSSSSSSPTTRQTDPATKSATETTRDAAGDEDSEVYEAAAGHMCDSLFE